MNKRLKYNLQSFGLYVFISYVFLLPLAFLNIGFYYINIPISLMNGWLFSMLNSIYIELRRLNGKNSHNLMMYLMKKLMI